MCASSLGRLLATGLAGWVACGAATAQAIEAHDEPAPLSWRFGPESRVERYTDDRAGLAQREWSQVDVRLWARRGGQSLGIGVGAVSSLTLAPALGREPPRLVDHQVGPALTVAWRAQLGEDASVYADTSTMSGRLVGETDNRPYVSTRGGVDWKLSESRFGFDRGRLSMRLDSGYRMSLRVRGGGVGVMLRGQF